MHYSKTDNGILFGKAYNSGFKINSEGEPVFTTEFVNGDKKTLKGEDAIYAAMPNFLQEPISALRKQRILAVADPDNPKNSDTKWKIKNILEDYANRGMPSAVDKILNKGALPGGLTGAGVGFVGGAALDWLLNLANGGRHNLPSMKVLGALGLGGVGATLGYAKKNLIDNELGLLEKGAALYNDPRNFILEKLQAATDIGRMDKVKVAQRVRNLDMDTAKALAVEVRELLGHNVGNFLAKYFSTSTESNAVGGLIQLISKGIFDNIK